MTDLIATNRKTAILGMGATGLSAARFLSSQGKSFVFADSRREPPRLDEVRQQYPGVPVVLGPFAEDLLLDFTNVVVSPGISLDEPALVAAREKGVTLHGDVELFLEHADAPVIVITGSNGKSTVTQLVGEMAEASGLTVGVGGNLGTPMLDLLVAVSVPVSPPAKRSVTEAQSEKSCSTTCVVASTDSEDNGPISSIITYIM